MRLVRRNSTRAGNYRAVCVFFAAPRRFETDVDRIINHRERRAGRRGAGNGREEREPYDSFQEVNSFSFPFAISPLPPSLLRTENSLFSPFPDRQRALFSSQLPIRLLIWLLIIDASGALLNRRTRSRPVSGYKLLFRPRRFLTKALPEQRATFAITPRDIRSALVIN